MLIELALAAALSQDPAPSTSQTEPLQVVRNASDLPWLRTPPIEYPERALFRQVFRGEAVLDCAVGAQGALTGCRIVSESPTDMGFGQAALRGLLRGQLDPARWSEPRVAIRLGFAGRED